MLTDKLNELLEPVVVDLGYDLVYLELVGDGSDRCLRLFIDHSDGIGLEDCEAVSREASALMDVEDMISGEYRLEVSSPGLDRPLAKASHFEQFVGQEARVLMQFPIDGRRRFRGRIVSVEAEVVRLAYDGVEVDLAIAGMERARLVPDFG